MRKICLCFGMALLSIVAFAANKVEKKVAQKPLSVMSETVCATKSSTISNSSTGESITVSSTKCDVTMETATAEALACASGGAKKLIPYIE